MNPQIRMLGVWSGVAFFLFFLMGLALFAGWVPPIEPTQSAQEIADMMRSSSVRIRIGMVFMVIGATFYLPFTMLISDLIKEIEGKSYFLSGTQLACGILSMLTFFLPAYNWTAAAFRPERSPEITQAFVDQGWLMFITANPPFLMQYLAIAIAIFMDKRPVPAFPRWAGFMQLWVGLIFFPGMLAIFMKNGPFAWNGLITWWIAVVAFAVWFVLMIALTRKSILIPRDDNER